jgi:hypothetical protein
MRRSLAQIIDTIEVTARNKLEPRDRIVDLCDEARRSLMMRHARSDPTQEAVMLALEQAEVDAEGLMMLDGDYLTTARLMKKIGLKCTPPNYTKIGRMLSGLGYVRLARTRVHPSARWFAPRAYL